MPSFTPHELDLIKQSAIELSVGSENYTAVLRLVQNRDFVLLGEATHGTHEFYEARIEITKRLISEQGVVAIAVEADWPSAYRINRYVRWCSKDASASEALTDFQRFPLWMWRNRLMLEFIEWLRKHNEGLPAEQQVGFYGLDMYSMYQSIAAVLDYLDQVDPDAASEARDHYSCLDHAGDETRYGYGVALGRRPSCEDRVVAELIRLQEMSMIYAKQGDPKSEEDQFQAEQNARLIQAAESYYRQIFDRRVNTWNLRDTHMFETLNNLREYLSRRLPRPPKIVVWEHNSHIGNALATDMGMEHQHSVGQLIRERYGKNCCLIGFTTHSGTVTAASEWGGPAEQKTIRNALPDSVEDIFHSTKLKQFFLPITTELTTLFNRSFLQRAIGVVYLPDNERSSHYFHCQLANQFDAVIHFDETRALEPLDIVSEWVPGGEQTYPFGV